MAADVLGIISGGLGIISFILGQTPGSNDGPSVSVELTVGYASNPNTGEQLDSPGGKFGHVYLFSPQNEQIGDKDIGGHNVGAGVSYQFDVDSTGEQPEYLEVTATNNAVCMSWMAVTYGSDVASGTYAFFGDFFDYCGLGQLEWYYGGVSAGQEKDGGATYYPKCGWIDKDHTNGHAYGSLKARMPYFKDYNSNQPKSFFCRPPGLEFGTDTNVINKREHSRDVKAPRSSGTRGDDSLVASFIASHSAIELCNSPSSSGPDFVSLTEGLYCDMTTREVQALCTDDVSEDCFDLNVAEKSMTSRISRDVTKHTTKNFSRVLVWDGK